MTDRELRSRRMLVGAVTASLILIAMYSWFHLTTAKAEATQARQTLADCETLIESIQELGQKPTRVLTQSNSYDTINELVTGAVAKARLSASAMQSVKPAETERLGRSDYMVVKNRVIFERVTMRQILQVIQALESRSDSQPSAGATQDAGTAGLRVRDLTLTLHDTSRPGNEVWNVEAVLTQTVYSPTKR